jgi:hypothetical protein
MGPAFAGKTKERAAAFESSECVPALAYVPRLLSDNRISQPEQRKTAKEQPKPLLLS